MRFLDPVEQPDAQECECLNCEKGEEFETGEDHFLALIAQPWNHPYETFDATMECRYCGGIGSYIHTEPDV